MSRPTTLTPEIQKSICEALRAGNTRKDAGLYAGVTVKCLTNWVTKGHKGVSPYEELVDDMRKAEAAAVVRNLAIIQKAANETWQAAAWWLERKYPKQWSKDSTIINRLEKEIERLERLLREQMV